MMTVTISKESFVAQITINRPEKLNAINSQLVSELSEVIEQMDSDESIRVAILTGSGEKAFSAGADIAEMSELSPAKAKMFADKGHALMAKIEASRVPVIAAVNGVALGGGCELALACDFMYASEQAKFGQPEVMLGVMPGFGGTQRLVRRVGIGRARELCFTGEMLGAQAALAAGLVNAVVPHAELMTRVREVASKIAMRGPLAVAAAKRAILRGADVPLATANELEATAFASLFGSEDQREGMRAFTEKPKRTPSFKGA